MTQNDTTKENAMLTAKFFNCYGDELNSLSFTKPEWQLDTMQTIIRKKHISCNLVHKDHLPTRAKSFTICNADGQLVDSGDLWRDMATKTKIVPLDDAAI